MKVKKNEISNCYVFFSILFFVFVYKFFDLSVSGMIYLNMGIVLILVLARLFTPISSWAEKLFIIVYLFTFVYGREQLISNGWVKNDLIANVYYLSIFYLSILSIMTFIVNTNNPCKGYYLNGFGLIISKNDYVLSLLKKNCIYLIYLYAFLISINIYFFVKYNSAFPELNNIFLLFVDNIHSSLKDIFSQDYQQDYHVKFSNEKIYWVADSSRQFFISLMFFTFFYFLTRSTVEFDEKNKNKIIYIYLKSYRKKLFKALITLFIISDLIGVLILFFVTGLSSDYITFTPEYIAETIEKNIFYGVMFLFLKIIFLSNFYFKESLIFKEFPNISLRLVFLFCLWLVVYKITVFLNAGIFILFKNVIIIPLLLFCTYYTIVFFKYFYNVEIIISLIIFIMSCLFFVLFLFFEFKKMDVYLSFVIFVNISLNSKYLINLKNKIESKLFF